MSVKEKTREELSSMRELGHIAQRALNLGLEGNDLRDYAASFKGSGFSVEDVMVAINNLKAAARRRQER